MRRQQEREDQAVAIATALALFVLILVAVGLVASWIQSLTHGLDGHEELIIWPAVLLAGIVACSHLTRSTRR